MLQIMYQEYQIQFPRCPRAPWSGLSISFPGQDDQSVGYTLYNFHPAKTSNSTSRKAFSLQTMMPTMCGHVKWQFKGKAGHPFSMFTLKRGTASTLFAQRNCLNATLRWNKKSNHKGLNYTAAAQHNTLRALFLCFPWGCSHLKRRVWWMGWCHQA